MNITQIITELLDILKGISIDPVSNLLEQWYGIGLDEITIKLGFGSVEWFNMPLEQLLLIILGLAVGFIILRLIYRFIKWLFRLGKGLTGIRK